MFASFLPQFLEQRHAYKVIDMTGKKNLFSCLVVKHLMVVLLCASLPISGCLNCPYDVACITLFMHTATETVAELKILSLNFLLLNISLL